MKNTQIDILLVLVFVISVAVALIPKLGDATRAVTALPAAGAVIAAIFQIFRDEVAHDRAMAIQATQNSFAIGLTSHMANVAFDKHVLFSEEYVAETFRYVENAVSRRADRAGPTTCGHAV